MLFQICSQNSDALDRAVATFSPWAWTINIMSSGKDKDKFSGTEQLIINHIIICHAHQL